MRKFILKFITIFCVLLFVSCEKTPDFTINGKLIDRIILSQDDEDYYTFKYDNQNRFVESKHCITRFIDEYFFHQKFSYPNDKKIVVKTYDFDEITNTKTINLNNDGTIKDDRTYKNGYLKTYTDSDGDKETYNWENGKLKSSILKYKSKTSTYETTQTFEYGTISNNPCSIDLFWLIASNKGTHNAGRFGRVPDKLISSYTITNTEDNSTSTTNFTYEIDLEGYVTKIYRSVDGAASELLYKIEYK